MATDIAIFRINYKSDFIITLESDAGWTTPFCIKFWTDSPQRAFYVQYDGETYTHCAPVAGEPTKLMVQMDDHHLGIGNLQYQIAYHFTVADFPNDTEDEVLNQAAVIIDEDGQQEQVMLDLNGETAPEIAFSLPAYANEQQRIANEQQRIANEEQRITNEEQRINKEQQRITNENQRITNEEARVAEFARFKRESEAATEDANEAAVLATTAADLASAKAQLAQDAATLANQKAQLAADKAALADSAATLATQKAQLAQEKATYAQTQGDYAKAQGDYAKAEGDAVKALNTQMTANEQTRQQQEQARQAAEQQRVTEFEQQMQQQQSAYETAEANRESAFETAEARRDAEVDEKVADITDLQDNVTFINKSFGKYDGQREITLAQAIANKYVNTNGDEVAANGYGISTPLSLNAGDILLIPSAQAVPASVSVVARMVQRTYQKIINYAYTYRTDYPELPATATADYDPTLVYTAVYDESGETPTLTGWTMDGETYTTLPATREVSEQFYEPLVKQAVSAMPSTGYYIYLCPTAMTVVVSGLTATVSGGVALVVGWSIFKNIITNFVGAPGQSVLAQAFAVLFAAIDGLRANLDNLGETRAKCIDSDDLPKVCGQPLVVEGEGAPVEVPQFVGQRYHDTTDKKVYEAFSVTNAIADWVLLN